MLASTAHVAPTVTIPLPCISSQVVFSPRIARRRRRTTGLTSTITIRVLGATDLLVILRVTFWQRLTPLRVSPAITTPSPVIADVLVVHPAGALSAYVGSLRTISNIGVGVVVTAFLPALWPPTAHPMANTRLMGVNVVTKLRVARRFGSASVDVVVPADFVSGRLSHPDRRCCS